MTKPITSLAFMMLVEEGRVGLDDPVSRYIPAWSRLAVRGRRTSSNPMRIRDLLVHTSGLTYGLQYRTEIDALYREAVSMQPGAQSLGDFVAALADIPLEFEPGTAWNYSVSTDVLGHLIEALSGQSFRDFLRHRIFDPLGMSDTDFSVSSANRGRLAEVYVRRTGELLSLPGPSFDADRTGEPTFLSGGGGLLSTVKDYLKICDLILNRGSVGGVRLLSRQTVDLMCRNHLPRGGDLPASSQGLFSDPAHTGIGFGLGWATTIDPADAQLPGNRGDASWSGMANTFFWCDPAEDLSCVFMTQLLPSEVYPLQRDIKSRVYAALEGAGS
jgi:CubicO group peptidase (beta-lactamase class C family)